MIFYYLDASAWVKRYYREIGTAWVQGIFAQNQVIACGTLGVVEVMATLARKRKAGGIDHSEFEQKVHELEADWERFIQIQLTDEGVRLAKQVARDMALRGADAIHLASALLLQQSFVEEDDHLIFATSDHELKKAAQSSELVVVDPEEQEEQELPKPEEKEPEGQSEE